MVKRNKTSQEEQAMSTLSKDQIKEMIQRYDIKTTDTIKTAYNDMFDETIQVIMEAELDAHYGMIETWKTKSMEYPK
jgi:hypothetical protein